MSKKWDKTERDIDNKKTDLEIEKWFAKEEEIKNNERRIKALLKELDAAQMRNNHKKLFSDGLIEHDEVHEDYPDLYKDHKRIKKVTKIKSNRKSSKKCKCK